MTVALDLDDIQGLIVRGYGRLGIARLLFLGITDPAAARRWLAAVADEITPGRADPDDASMHVAFTYAGLEKLGLHPEALATKFPQEFVKGMTTDHRRRQLGDLDGNAPEHWSWGGPTTSPVHLVQLLYAKDEQVLKATAERHERAREGLVTVKQLADTVDLDRKEHFGFHDGISQPLIEGLPKAGPLADPDTVRAGEIILGYKNGYDRYTERPLLPAAADPSGLLPRDPEGSGAADLGRNGSYLVIRQLRQHVRDFWQFLDRATRRPDGSGDEAALLRLAAKMVGRWQSGAPLVMAPDQDVPALADANDFEYAHADVDGYRCPIGAHVRRANPRDSLDPDPGSQRSVDVGKGHRILRRGRAYGQPLSRDAALAGTAAGQDGDGDRGLYFMCLNANIARQFEFIQHTWVNNAKFGGLYDDPDPVIAAGRGLGSTFTVQAIPVRQRVTAVPSFVDVVGGAYFFLPGIRAVRYLASLDGA